MHSLKQLLNMSLNSILCFCCNDMAVIIGLILNSSQYIVFAGKSNVVAKAAVSRWTGECTNPHR